MVTKWRKIYCSGPYEIFRRERHWNWWIGAKRNSNEKAWWRKWLNEAKKQQWSHVGSDESSKESHLQWENDEVLLGWNKQWAYRRRRVECSWSLPDSCSRLLNSRLTCHEIDNCAAHSNGNLRLFNGACSHLWLTRAQRNQRNNVNSQEFWIWRIHSKLQVFDGKELNQL